MKNVKHQVYKEKKYEADVSSVSIEIEIIAARGGIWGGLDDVLREVNKIKNKVLNVLKV
jgi:hypothetical protein